jgi:hypothetical protein
MIQHATEYRPRQQSGANVNMIERLAKIAESVALDAGLFGITVSDIRMEAFRKGLLTGYEKGHQLSYLGSVPPAAGLVKTTETRRSTLAVTHRVRQVVWVHPSFVRSESPYLPQTCSRSRGL